MSLPTFTDEKLEEYLATWNRLMDRGYKVDGTLTEDYGCFAFPLQRRYTLTYGEEKRELTEEQAFRVKTWLESLVRK